VTEIVEVDDLPVAVQSDELVDLMVEAANSKASRVAPCLTDPILTWAGSTAYPARQSIVLAGGESLRAVYAGTSAGTAPVAPPLDGTVVDGSVTWQRIGPTEDVLSEARLILVGAIKRWSEAGSGALSQETSTTGPYSTTRTVDTRQRTGFNLWPSEITQLQELCKSGGTAAAFSVDTAPAQSGRHLPWCSASLGATFCSCGADIAGVPIYEGGGY
jgi:hypothetical protein